MKDRFTIRSTPASVMLVLGVLLATLAACGDDDSPSSESTPGTSSSSESGSPAESPSPTEAALTDSKCPAEATSADSFKVGGIIPLTGSLAFYGPQEVAAVGLAVSDINAADGVNGAQACYDIQDSGDTTDLSISTASANTLSRGKPSVVIGAASSGVSLNVVDTFASNKITEVSPANTALDLSGYSPYYFRTAPPDTIQGGALGTLISQDGYSKVGFLVVNDTAATGNRDVVQATVEAVGGSCVYGCTGDGDEFPAGQTTFTAEVAAVTAAQPDAIVILTFDEVKSIVPELAGSGFDMSRTYYIDGTTVDHSKDFAPGTLEGAQGTIPGADASEEFKKLLSDWYQQTQGSDLEEFTYAGETYDAVILAALAAAKGKSNVSQTVRDNFADVSGATGGTECSSFAECLPLVEAGEEIRYKGISGIGPIDEENDPSSAFVGVYEFDANNRPVFSSTVEVDK